MKKKLTVVFLSGVISTLAILLIIYLLHKAGYFGLYPNAEMAQAWGVSEGLLWVWILVKGWVTAWLYVFIFEPQIKLSNKYLKGLVYGLFLYGLGIVAWMGLEEWGKLPRIYQFCMQESGIFGLIGLGIMLCYGILLAGSAAVCQRD